MKHQFKIGAVVTFTPGLQIDHTYIGVIEAKVTETYFEYWIKALDDQPVAGAILWCKHNKANLL